MRVHHLNCISECPLGGALMDAHSVHPRARLSVHCLAIETREGLVLVDTGFGLGDVYHPKKRLSRFFLAVNAPDFREEMTALRQLERLGFRASDVRHILMTHLDFDHAGGIEDFPHARVHLLASERDAAVARRTMLDRMRYRPQQWGGTQHRWHLYRGGEGDTWYGFDAVRGLTGVSDDILLVPLVGHTLGHAGIAVRGDAGWMFLTGDAYFWRNEMDPRRPRCTPGLAAYQWLMDKDHRARRWNQQRLRELKARHGREVRVFCSHDPVEFEALSGRPLEVPLGAQLRRLQRPGKAVPAMRPPPGLRPVPPGAPPHWQG
jgi:glyoxylase-like metal-dependent hydrolase (beta-lactamase superfamily II)